MSKPMQPGDKLTISTRKSDGLALAWLNTQRNRSEAVMELIRAAAFSALFPIGAGSHRRPDKAAARPAPVPSAGSQTKPASSGFAGLGDFFAGMESMPGKDV